MIAAFGAGWYGSIVEAAEAMSGPTRVVAPDAAAGERYMKLLDIYRGVYASTARINAELVAFAHETEG
jgi:xylulokinase